MKPSAAIFDLDGTLLDTIQDISNSANEVLGNFSLPKHELSAYRIFAGDGLDILFQRALPPENSTEEMVKRCVEEFAIVYGRRWRQHSKPFPGIQTLLDNLCEKNIRLAVLSNKMDYFTKAMTAEMFPKTKFEVVLGARPGIPKKPDPAGAHEIADLLALPPSEIFFVGDTSTDIKTARAARMIPLGVLWGFREEQELRENGAKYILREPRDMLDLLPS